MAKNTVGRPTRYNQTIIDRICALVLDGQPIRFICSQVDMPSLATVMRWLCDYPDFAAMYAQAKEMYAHSVFDEIIHIADTCDPMDVQKAKLMIEAIVFSFKTFTIHISCPLKGLKDELLFN